MKAKIEETSVQYRGVVLISETEDEGKILWDIWCCKGRPVSIGKLTDGSFELVMAPSAEEEDDQSKVLP